MVNCFGFTPLYLAVGMPYTESAALLLDFDGSLFLEKFSTFTVLDLVISLGFQPFIDLFIQRYMKYVAADKGALSLHWILSTAKYVNGLIELPVEAFYQWNTFWHFELCSCRNALISLRWLTTTRKPRRCIARVKTPKLQSK